jgi:molybdopterin/thiamine biosynthesis adenylyltransferase
MTNLKVAIIGCGGIGSYFIRSLSEVIKKDIAGFNKINPLAIDLIDFDLAEEKNFAYTIYDIEHLDRNKAEVLADITGYRAIKNEIKTVEQLDGYDFIILCVDNNKVRNLIYDSNIPFLDLRAKGSSIMAFLTRKELDNNNEYRELTIDDGAKGGCQYEADLEDRNIEFGNRIIAEIGLQILKRYLKGEVEHKNYILMI